MKTARTRLALVAVAVMLAVMLPSIVRSQIAPGTTLSGTIDKSLNTKNAQVGERFLLTNVNSQAYSINGATAYGHVESVTSGGQGRKAQIKLAIDKINTRSGSIYKLTGHVVDVKANTKSNAGREAGSTAAGALVGGLIGKGWGAVIGGATGFLVSKNAHQDITVPQGSLVTFQIDSARRQSQG
jgi:CRISPR/Cas system-associated endonuclease Cas3-HD